MFPWEGILATIYLHYLCLLFKLFIFFLFCFTLWRIYWCHLYLSPFSYCIRDNLYGNTFIWFFYQQMIFFLFLRGVGSQSLFDGNTVSEDYWFLNVGSSLLLHELLTSSKLRGLNALFIHLDFSCVLWCLSSVLWSLVFIVVKCVHGFPWVCE